MRTEPNALFRDVMKSLARLWYFKPPPPISSVCNRLRELNLWCPNRTLGSRRSFRLVPRRGQRSGQHEHEHFRLQHATAQPAKSTDLNAPLTSSECKTVTNCDFRVCNSHSNSLPTVPTDSRQTKLSFAGWNAQSLSNKFDDFLELCRDQHIDVVCVSETWQDSESVVFDRLRQTGFNVVDRARPRLRHDLSTNHGGVAVIAAGGITTVPVSIPSYRTFEAVCARLTVTSTNFLIVAFYRPGSEQVQQQFFDEFSQLLESVATYQTSLFVVGDVNIRLDRPADPHTVQFCSIVSSSGLVLHQTSATHRRGGTLDVVLSRVNDGMPPFTVNSIDAGLSDHHFLQWSVTCACPPEQLKTVYRRSWKNLDTAQFRAAVTASPLCCRDVWPDDVSQLANIYSTAITSILDSLIPISSFQHRPRTSDPWFDADCRMAKRQTRRLERAYAAADRRARSVGTDSAGSAIPAAAAAKAAWYTQRRAYRLLREAKRQEFWTNQVENCHNSRQLWNAVDKLLGRGKVQSQTDIDVSTISTFFTEKVEAVRQNTAVFPPPTFSIVPPGISFTEFPPVDVDEVISLIHSLPDKTSDADPLPACWLKVIATDIAPLLTELFNRSLSSGVVPDCFKTALITPIVKKQGLDVTDLKSYRPISNLPIISKLLERVVARRLVDYISSANLLPVLQSGFRSLHSVETAVTKVLSDIISAVDKGDVAALVLLDMSAAFDTVDHHILLQRLRLSYGVSGKVLQWITSYLDRRHEIVRRGSLRSDIHIVTSGVPQGSVLGPLLFIIYTAELIALIEKHHLTPHLYADDTQLYGSCPASQAASLIKKLSSCLEEVASWLGSNRLQLNTSKTEFIWFATSRRLQPLMSMPLQVGADIIMPSKSVRNLGVIFDNDLTMRGHVDRTVARCFAALRQLRSVRRSLPASAFQTLVTSLVISRLDFGNTVLYGLPNSQMRRLQAVLNASARLIFGLRRHDHISDALLSLHWLRVPERLTFKVAVLAYRALHGLAPAYLANDFQRISETAERSRLRSSETTGLLVPRHRINIGARGFSVAGPIIWNSLPRDITSTSSLLCFRKQLKTFLFSRSYPDIV